MVSERVNLDDAHASKTDKYRNLEDVVKRRYNVETVRFGSITLNYRVVWSARSVKDLADNRVLKRPELKIISSRVVIAELAAFWRFCKQHIYRQEELALDGFPTWDGSERVTPALQAQ